MRMSSPAMATTVPTKIVKCPCCGGISVYAATNRYRPFCSDRCKQIDLGAWASEQFAVPAIEPPDNLLPDDH